MLVSKIRIENVRSFLAVQELSLDGPLSIVIGPNGGGKTNLLDTLFMTLRRYLFASVYAAHAPQPERLNRHEFRYNDILNQLEFEPHTAGVGQPQIVTIDLQVTAKDVENMVAMKADAEVLMERAASKYDNANLFVSKYWIMDRIQPGVVFSYVISNGNITWDGDAASHFMQYLQAFEVDALLRQEYGLGELSLPLLYLPVNRAAQGFQSGVELASHNAYETKRHADATTSRKPSNIVSLAIGQLAQRFRTMLELDSGTAKKDFMKDERLTELTRTLKSLGYEWSLECTNVMKNQYDIRLKKQKASFLVSAASSGERELLTYLFAIYALNVRDALIIIDEPELHLHPKWQRMLLSLFVSLAQTTGNRFVLATHSPTFISPDSIQYVSRVFGKEQCSQIVRLDASTLPDARHLLNIVNSQNNERLFFADAVILVEGVSDRIFFEAWLDLHGRQRSTSKIIEIISVGGKGMFAAYEKVLTAAGIPFSIIADRDYIEQVGTEDVKALFTLNSKEIKEDVIDNLKSVDGESLVQAIEVALASGSWSHAQDLWAYIKSRRREVLASLDTTQFETLEGFIAARRAEGLYLLSRGALERYLPSRLSRKDLEKLVEFLATDGFEQELVPEGIDELRLIADMILDPLRAEVEVEAEGAIVDEPFAEATVEQNPA